jgi:hypothetical protein
VRSSNAASALIAYEEGAMRVPLEKVSADSLKAIGLVYNPDAAKPQRNAEDSAAQVKVQNIALKIVEVDGLLRKSKRFRYFFRIKNLGSVAFSGSVEIGLHYVASNTEITTKTFQGEIPPGGGDVVYIDTHTGPRKYHGDACIAGFTYAIDGGEKSRGATLDDVQGMK